MPAWDGTRAAARSRVPDFEHAWRLARREWRSHRAGISHRPLGSRPAGGGGRARVEGSARRPFAGAFTDPCDGRTQGTAGMLDSLPFRNDAAIVLRRLMRSLPTGKGIIGIATCDKGLPAMMMALASAAGSRGARSRGRHAAAGAGRRRGQGADHWRALRAEPDHAGICGGGWLPRMCIAGGWMPVPWNRSYIPGCRRGAGTGVAAHGARALGATHLA